MAKKAIAVAKSRKTSEKPVEQRVRIYFERIIPDELDPERIVRREMRKQMIDAAGGSAKLKANGVVHVTRMALINSKKWTP